MRVRDDADADVLFLVESGMARVDAVEEPGGIIITSGGYAEPVRIEFLNASERGMIDPGVVSAPAR